MARSTVMKALIATTVNLKDGAVLHVNPDHKSDIRARYPRITDDEDVERLEREKIARVHTGPIPSLDTDEARAEEERQLRRASAKEAGEVRDGKKPRAKKAAAGQAKPPARARRASGGPGVETADEAARAADEIEGHDPTLAPA